MILGREAKSAPVGVITKVLRILEALNASPAGLQLREIAEQTELNKSTAYRFLAHLESEGYLFRDESRAYMVGPRLTRLGSGSTYQTTLRKVSRSVLQELRDRTGKTANLGILEGQDVFYVDVVQSRNPFRMASRIGSTRPVYCTAMGKILTALLPPAGKERVLASIRFERFTQNTITHLGKLKQVLEEAQQRGYALDNEEATLGARCISAPVILEGDRLVAAVSVSGPTNGIMQSKIPFLVEAVQSATRIIATQLSGSGLQ